MDDERACFDLERRSGTVDRHSPWTSISDTSRLSCFFQTVVDVGSFARFNDGR